MAGYAVNQVRQESRMRSSLPGLLSPVARWRNEHFIGSIVFQSKCFIYFYFLALSERCPNVFRSEQTKISRLLAHHEWPGKTARANKKPHSVRFDLSLCPVFDFSFPDKMENIMETHPPTPRYDIYFSVPINAGSSTGYASQQGQVRSATLGGWWIRSGSFTAGILD